MSKKKQKKQREPEAEPDLEAWFARRFGPDADDDAGSPTGTAVEARNLTMIATLFERAERLLDVPGPRVARAIERLHQDDLHALKNEEIAWPVRERCIEAIGDLFERYFARSCRDRLGHLAKTGGDTTEVESACYMWWDVIPLGGRPGPTTDAVLDVLERTLALPSLACQEAALHGLGHWQHVAKKRVEQVIDRYLARRGVPDPLAAYARQARTGYIQ